MRERGVTIQREQNQRERERGKQENATNLCESDGFFVHGINHE